MVKGKESFRLKYAFLVILVFALGLSLGLAKSRKVGAVTDDIYERLRVFADVLSIIQKDYVDAEKTDSEGLVYGGIQGMLTALDPHSSFMPPDMFKEAQLDTKGKYEGLGIEIGVRDGVLTVVAPIEGTPAWKAGIKPNDQILKIDGEPTKKMSFLETVHRLRGPKDTTVTITIMRKGFDRPKDFTITRGVIPIRSVRSEIPEDGYSYTRISTFSERTVQEFREALREWKGSTQGPRQGLILDLRDNPGGLLDQAVKVADQFIDSGAIVSIKGRLPASRATYTAHSEGTEEDYPIVVLVSSGSASGSEIVAGALQDHDRAVIVGTKTFGKASVQTLYPLRDGSGLRLTTGRYFTPHGRDIQAEGIEPDVFLPPLEVEEEEDEERQEKPRRFLEKDLEGHLEPTYDEERETRRKPANPAVEAFIDGLKEKAKAEDKEIDGQKFVALGILKNWKTFHDYLREGGEID
jgi:carboxyl-terminal processing protease